MANALRDIQVPQPPFPLTPDIAAAVKQVIQRNLPGLDAASGNPAIQANPTVHAINQLTTRIQEGQDRDAEYRRTGKTKTPAEYFKKSGDILMRITCSPSLDELPPLFLSLIGSNERTERITLEEQLRATADELGLLHYAPVVTPSLAKKVATFNFAHCNLDNLSGGFHPVLTSYLDPSARTALDDVSDAYDELLKGTGASLQDIQLLKEAKKIGAPQSMEHATFAYKSCRVLYHALLGSRHPFVRAFDQFVSLHCVSHGALARGYRFHLRSIIPRSVLQIGLMRNFRPQSWSLLRMFAVWWTRS